MGGPFLTELMVWYVVFLFSTTLHEAMHSYAAAWGGDNTAYLSGQATLNPLPHIQRERFGMILVPLVSFFLYQGQWMIGWASAPYNPVWAARHPKKAFLMSLAGPLSHLPAVAISFTVMYFGLRNGFFAYPSHYGDMFPVAVGDGGSAAYALAFFLNIVFKLNIILLIFNLIPLPPLDGAGVWDLFIQKEESRLRWHYTAASYSLAGLALAWWLFPRIYSPIYSFLLRILYLG